MKNTQWKLQIILRTHVSYPADYKHRNVFLLSFFFSFSLFCLLREEGLVFKEICARVRSSFGIRLNYLFLCVVWRVWSRFQFKDDRFERLSDFKDFYGEWEWMLKWETHSRTYVHVARIGHVRRIFVYHGFLNDYLFDLETSFELIGLPNNKLLDRQFKVDYPRD